MPAIKAAIPVGDGISVFTYAKGKEGWFVRKWIKHERRYYIKKIEGATTEQGAMASFYKALLEMEQTKQRVNQKRETIDKGLSMAELVDEFLQWEQGRVDAGLKDEDAAVRRGKSLRPMLMYLDSKGITHPSQINLLTWEDYPLFRKDCRKWTRKTELKDIGVFCRMFLAPRGYLTNELVLDKHFIPKITITDDELDANPAITPDDYKVINNFLRVPFQKQAGSHRGVYSKRMFYTFVHLLKNSGCRPDEMMNIRRRDITITNPMRWSESKQEWEDDYKLKLHIRKSKTGKKRDVVCRSNSGAHLVEFLKFQREYLDKYFPRVTFDNDCFLFGQPAEFFQKTFNYRYLCHLWEGVRQDLKGQLTGNKFSDRNYTLYSLRSTFIENCIADGLDVYLVARLCGNSVTIIQKHYDRHDVVKRAEEIQSLPIGVSKPPTPEVVDINAL